MCSRSPRERAFRLSVSNNDWCSYSFGACTHLITNDTINYAHMRTAKPLQCVELSVIFTQRPNRVAECVWTHGTGFECPNVPKCGFLTWTHTYKHSTIQSSVCLGFTVACWPLRGGGNTYNQTHTFWECRYVRVCDDAPLDVRKVTCFGNLSAARSQWAAGMRSKSIKVFDTRTLFYSPLEILE